MKIIKCWAENYGIISERQTFKFDDGITLIIGNNGNGKSTIPKLMKLCLFNEVDEKLENEINWNADYFDIGLTFDHQCHNYNITIHYDGKTTNRVLTIDSHQILKGQDAIDYLKEHFTPSIFQAAAFAMQDGDDNIIKMKPSEKRVGLQKVFDLEFKAEIAEIENDIKLLKENDLKNIEKELYRLEHIIYDIKEALELPFDNITYDTHKLRLESIISSLALIQNNIDQYNKLSNDIILRSADIIKLEQQKVTLDNDVIKLEREISDLTQSNKLIDIDQTIMVRENTNKLIVTKLTNQLIEKQKESDKIKVVRIPAWGKQIEIDKLNDSLIDLKSKINDNKKKGVAWSKGVCGECGTTFSHTEIEIEKLREEIRQQLLKQQQIEIQIKALQADKLAYDQSVKDNDQCKQNKELLKKDIESIELQIKNANSQLETDKKQIRQSMEDTIKKNNELVDSKKENLKSKKESVQEKTDGITTLKQNKNDLIIEQKKLNVDEEQKNKLEQEKTNLNKLIDSYLLIFNENIVILKNNKVLEQQKIDDQRLLIDVKIKRDQIVSDINDLEKALVILKKELPANILAELIIDIQNGMNKFIDKIYYKSLDVRIKEVKDGIHINYGYKGKGISKKASGFESQLLTLAYKDALNKKSEIGLIILDEMDNNATEDNALKLYEMFGSMRALYNQLIIITHNEMAKNLLRNNYNANIITMEGGKIV